ncbi:MAG TPA: SDR family NAD(P)-dependent oxidoreductase, partial [Geminicoccaceae bacterium]
MNDASPRQGPNGATAPISLGAPAVLRRRSMVLITGGSGFVGANLADRLAASGEHVLIYDNLSRPNVMANLEWLQQRHGHRIETAIADVRDSDALRDTMRQASAVFHLAAQVAVTTSLEDPVTDFEVNARGTLNVLEAARHLPDPPPLIFASTNKVYGESFETARLLADRSRYRPADGTPPAVDEGWPLGLCSPYGCSKGAADAYVLDYARVFGLRTV